MKGPTTDKLESSVEPNQLHQMVKIVTLQLEVLEQIRDECKAVTKYNELAGVMIFSQSYLMNLGKLQQENQMESYDHCARMALIKAHYVVDAFEKAVEREGKGK